jgi:hypothetical protein
MHKYTGKRSSYQFIYTVLLLSIPQQIGDTKVQHPPPTVLNPSGSYFSLSDLIIEWQNNSRCTKIKKEKRRLINVFNLIFN